MPTKNMGKRRAVDLGAVSFFMRTSSVSEVYIEQVWTRPQDGRVGAMRFAEGAAEIRGLLFGLGVQCIQVSPQRWMKDLGLKAEKAADGTRTKASNLRLAQMLWPTESWLASTRSKKPHDGMVDAALIAYYGLQKTRDPQEVSK